MVNSGMRLRPGGWCWVGLGGGIVAADAILIWTDNPTMSQVFGQALEHPLRKWPVMFGAGVVVAHLFGRYIPTRLHPFDPIGQLARRAPRSRSSRAG